MSSSSSSSSICPTPLLSTSTFTRVLHQTWIPPDDKAPLPPSEIMPLTLRWSIALPGWEHRTWTMADNRKLWARHFPEMLPVYDGYPHAVQRADASRLVYMSIIGGLYADLDVAPCNSLLNRLPMFGKSLLLVKCPPRYRGVCNFFFGSIPGHPFWRFALSRLEIATEASKADIMRSTGPFQVSAAWKAYRSAANASGCLQDVDNSTLVIGYDDFEKTMGAHHWSGIWHGRPNTTARAQFNPTLQMWLGINRSAACVEARFDDVIEGSWQCQWSKFNCPMATWGEFMRVCNGSKYGCPRYRRNGRPLDPKVANQQQRMQRWFARDPRWNFPAANGTSRRVR